MNPSTEPVGRDMAILAHELREPLSSILFAIQVAKETPHDEAPTREMCSLVERQARYAANLIDEILDASRAAYGKLAIKKELLDLTATVADAVEATSAVIDKRRHLLHVSLPQEKVHVMADPLRFRQIVINLLSNAAKYTEPGGIIRLEVETKAGTVTITVRDNGIGIPQDLLPRIFDMFPQGEGEAHKEARGLGVGLAMVKLLAELHGGTVVAHSRGERTGSVFVVRLPGVAQAEADSADFSYMMDQCA